MDDRDAWSEHQPSAREENEYISNMASRSAADRFRCWAAGHALSDLVMTSGRNTVARTKAQVRRDAATSRQGRFARGSTHQAQPPRRFARSAGQTESARRFGRASARPSGGAPRRHRRQTEQSGAQKLIQGIRGWLPGGGKSSAKPGRRPGGSRGARRGRKPAMLGLLGAGAAGAAAVVAKRRHGSRSPQPPEGDASGMSEPQTPSTATPASALRSDTPMPGETADRSDDPVGDESARGPDTPAEGDQRG